MKDESSVPAAQKMTDASLLIFRVEVQKRRVQMIDDIAAVTSVDRCLNGIRVAGDHDRAVRRFEAIPVALHRVFRSERSDGDLFAFVDDSCLDFVRVHLPRIGKATYVAYR